MSADVNARLGSLLTALQTELDIASSTLRAKGLKRFQRPLAVGLCVVFLSWRYVYAPWSEELARIEPRIAKAQTLGQSAEPYQQALDRMTAALARLPSRADRPTFLTSAALDSLQAEGITSETLRQPTESKRNGLYLQTMRVSAARVTFAQAMDWLARVERSSPTISVTMAEISKGQGGKVQLQADLAAAFPIEDVALPPPVPGLAGPSVPGRPPLPMPPVGMGPKGGPPITGAAGLVKPPKPSAGGSGPAGPGAAAPPPSRR